MVSFHAVKGKCGNARLVKARHNGTTSLIRQRAPTQIILSGAGETRLKRQPAISTERTHLNESRKTAGKS